MKIALAYASIALGLTMVVTGIFWKQVIPKEVYWSEEDQQEYLDAALAAHEAISGHSHSNSAGQRAKLDIKTAKERLDGMQSRLDSARTQHNNTGRYLSVGGLVFLIAGAAAVRQTGS